MEKTIGNLICGIYKITSPSGKVYIGQSYDIYSRWKGYKKILCKGQLKLYYSFKKHGVENHEFEIIKICEKNELDKFEMLYVKLYNSFSNGLNLTLGGDGIRIPYLSKEHKEKLSKSHIGQKAWNKGLRGMMFHSEETKKIMSCKHMGIKFSTEHKNNIRLSRLAKRINGKMIFSEEHKNNLSKSHLGQNAWNKGVPQSEEARKKNSNAQKVVWAIRKKQHNIF